MSKYPDFITPPLRAPWVVGERSAYFGVYSSILGGSNKERIVAYCPIPHGEARRTAEFIALAGNSLPNLFGALKFIRDKGYESGASQDARALADVASLAIWQMDNGAEMLAARTRRSEPEGE